MVQGCISVSSVAVRSACSTRRSASVVAVVCVLQLNRVCLQSKVGRKKSVKVKAKVKSSVSTTCKHIDPKFLDVEPPLISRDPIPYRGVLQLLGHCTLPVSQTRPPRYCTLYTSARVARAAVGLITCVCCSQGRGRDSRPKVRSSPAIL